MSVVSKGPEFEAKHPRGEGGKFASKRTKGGRTTSPEGVSRAVNRSDADAETYDRDSYRNRIPEHEAKELRTLLDDWVRWDTMTETRRAAEDILGMSSDHQASTEVYDDERWQAKLLLRALDDEASDNAVVYPEFDRYSDAAIPAEPGITKKSLWRGIGRGGGMNPNSNSAKATQWFDELFSLQVGDTVDFSLVATSPSMDVAEAFLGPSAQKSALLEFMPGTKVVTTHDPSSEAITSGRFRIAYIRQPADEPGTPADSGHIRLEQVGVWDLDKYGQLVKKSGVGRIPAGEYRKPSFDGLFDDPLSSIAKGASFEAEHPRGKGGRFVEKGLAGEAHTWPQDGRIPLDNLKQTAGATAWHRGVWEGTVAEDDVVAYRGTTSIEEIATAVATGKWASNRTVTDDFEGQTQMSGRIKDAIDINVVGATKYVVETQIGGLPAKIITPPEPAQDPEGWWEDAVVASRGEGIGIEGEIPARRILRVGKITRVDSDVEVEWFDPLELLDPESETWEELRKGPEFEALHPRGKGGRFASKRSSTMRPLSAGPDRSLYDTEKLNQTRKLRDQERAISAKRRKLGEDFDKKYAHEPDSTEESRAEYPKLLAAQRELERESDALYAQIREIEATIPTRSEYQTRIKAEVERRSLENKAAQEAVQRARAEGSREEIRAAIEHHEAVGRSIDDWRYEHDLGPAMEEWQYWAGVTGTRRAADAILGTPSDSDKPLQQVFGVDGAERYTAEAKALLRALGDHESDNVIVYTADMDPTMMDDSRPSTASAYDHQPGISEIPLFRGVNEQGGVNPHAPEDTKAYFEQLINAKPGETIDIGLTAVSPQQAEAERFAGGPSFGKFRTAVIKIEPGVKVVTSSDPSFEAITSGRFEVVSVKPGRIGGESTTDRDAGVRLSGIHGYVTTDVPWVVTLRQVGIWDTEELALAKAGIPRLDPRSYRRCSFDALFDEPLGDTIAKYSKDQARVPAGSPRGGEFAGARQVDPAPDKPVKEGSDDYTTRLNRPVKAELKELRRKRRELEAASKKLQEEIGPGASVYRSPDQRKRSNEIEGQITDTLHAIKEAEGKVDSGIQSASADWIVWEDMTAIRRAGDRLLGLPGDATEAPASDFGEKQAKVLLTALNDRESDNQAVYLKDQNPAESVPNTPGITEIPLFRGISDNGGGNPHVDPEVAGRLFDELMDSEVGDEIHLGLSAVAPHRSTASAFAGETTMGSAIIEIKPGAKVVSTNQPAFEAITAGIFRVTDIIHPTGDNEGWIELEQIGIWDTDPPKKSKKKVKKGGLPRIDPEGFYNPRFGLLFDAPLGPTDLAKGKDQPRVPAGSPHGGEWTSSGRTYDSDDDVTEVKNAEKRWTNSFTAVADIQNEAHRIIAGKPASERDTGERAIAEQFMDRIAQAPAADDFPSSMRADWAGEGPPKRYKDDHLFRGMNQHGQELIEELQAIHDTGGTWDFPLASFTPDASLADNYIVPPEHYGLYKGNGIMIVTEGPVKAIPIIDPYNRKDYDWGEAESVGITEYLSGGSWEIVSIKDAGPPEPYMRRKDARYEVTVRQVGPVRTTVLNKAFDLSEPMRRFEKKVAKAGPQQPLDPSFFGERWQINVADNMYKLGDDIFTEAMVRALMASMKAMLETGTLGDVLDQVKAGKFTNAEASILQAITGIEMNPTLINRYMSEAFTHGVYTNFDALRARSGATGGPKVGVEMNFTALNQHALQWAYQRSADLVTAITFEQRNIIRNLVEDALINGRGAEPLARMIERSIGLHPRFAQAVVNFEDGLKKAGVLSPIEVQAKTDKYAAKLRRSRARTIARTEIMTAQNNGQSALWIEMEKEGLVDRNIVRRKWIVARDEKLCPTCAKMLDPERRTTGLHEWFDTPLGPKWEPPMHPNCRCTMVLDVPDILELTRTMNIPVPVFEDGVLVEKYSKDQARDAHGRWTKLFGMPEQVKGKLVSDRDLRYLNRQPQRIFQNMMDPVTGRYPSQADDAKRRAYNEAYKRFADSSPEAKEFADAVNLWQGGMGTEGAYYDIFRAMSKQGHGSIKSVGDLRKLHPHLKTMPHEDLVLMAQLADSLDEAVVNAPKLQGKTLYRGLSIDTLTDEGMDFATHLQPGTVINDPIGSWSGNERVANAVGLARENTMGDLRVMLVVRDPRAVNITPLNTDLSAYRLAADEYLAGGRYKIVSVEHEYKHEATMVPNSQGEVFVDKGPRFEGDEGHSWTIIEVEQLPLDRDVRKAAEIELPDSVPAGLYFPDTAIIAKYSKDQPRNPAGSPTGGQFAGGGAKAAAGALTSSKPKHKAHDVPVEQVSHPAVQRLIDGREEYIRRAGLKSGPPEDYSQVKGLPLERYASIAKAYDDAKPNAEARKSFEKLRTEIHDQFDFLTKEMGIKVTFVDHDPYKNGDELIADLERGRMLVLKTDTTGPHPFFTNEENDMFRAVHDAFGHGASGRPFDRHGERAAILSHKRMFSDEAMKAGWTELQAQTSWLVTNGTFPEQKLVVLPEEFRKMLGSLRNFAKSEDYDVEGWKGLCGTYHPSLGRGLDEIEKYRKDQPRDAKGQFASVGGASTVTVKFSTAWGNQRNQYAKPEQRVYKDYEVDLPAVPEGRKRVFHMSSEAGGHHASQAYADEPLGGFGGNLYYIDATPGDLDAARLRNGTYLIPQKLANKRVQVDVKSYRRIEKHTAVTSENRTALLDDLNKLEDKVGYLASGRQKLGYDFVRYAIEDIEPASEVLVARSAGGDISGAIKFKDETYHGERRIYIDLLGSTHIEKGTGTKLVKAAARVAADRGLPLMGDPTPEARQFWKDLGWHFDPNGTGSVEYGFTAEEAERFAR